LIIGQESVEKRRKKLQCELERAYAELIGMGAERIVLAGSMADGSTSHFSDVDLPVVMRTQEPFLQRLRTAHERILPRVATDILTYTPEGLKELQISSPFIRRALKKGKVLHAA
jgi:predicted nucleotidyltransferase